MSNTQILSDAIIISLDIRVSSGSRTIGSDEAIPGVNGKPPAHLVANGRTRYIDTKAFNPLETIRRGAARDLETIGVKTPIGYVVPPQKEAEAYAAMDQRKLEFVAALATLKQDFDGYCSEWEQKPENAAYEVLIQHRRPTADQSVAFCGFEYAAYRAAPVESEKGKSQFASMANATVSAIAIDIAANAEKIAEIVGGKERVTQRTVSSVKELISKLDSFAMFDKRIGPAADALRQIVSTFPQVGPLDAANTLILGSMLQSIADPASLLAIGKRALDQASAPITTEVPAPLPATTNTTTPNIPASRAVVWA